jgi:hypothetical protein
MLNNIRHQYILIDLLDIYLQSRVTRSDEDKFNMAKKAVFL